MDKRSRTNRNPRDQDRHQEEYYYDNQNYHGGNGEVYRPDYRHRNYLHQNIPPIWDHKNIPPPPHMDYPHHYNWGGEKANSDERLHGSSSSVSGSSKSRVAIIIGIILSVLVVVGGAIAVAVYFTSLPNVSKTTVSTVSTTTPVPPQELKFQGKLSIDKNWDAALEDKDSPVYQQKAINVSKMIDKVYQQGDLKDVYLRNTINGFSQGSTVCNFTVQFRNPKVMEVTATKSPVVIVINEELVVSTFKKVLENDTSIQEEANLEIDTNTLEVSDVTPLAAVDTTTMKSTTTTTTPTTTTKTTTTTTPTTTTKTTTTTTPTTTITTVTTSTPTTTTTTPTTTKTTPIETTTAPTETMTTQTETMTSPTTTSTEQTTTTTTPAKTETTQTTTRTSPTTTTTTPDTTTTTPTSTTTSPTTTTTTPTSTTSSSTTTTTSPTTTKTSPTTTTTTPTTTTTMTSPDTTTTTTSTTPLTSTTPTTTTTSTTTPTPTTTKTTTTTSTTTTPTPTTTKTTTTTSTTTTPTPTTTKTTTTTPTTTTTTPATPTTVSTDSQVVFSVQMLMNNMTWMVGYNNTDSSEYQQLQSEVNKMDNDLRSYMSSMDSAQMTSNRMSMSEIYNRMSLKYAKPLNGKVTLYCEVVFNARYATMANGSIMTVDSLMVKDVVSASSGMYRDFVLVTDLSSSTTESSAKTTKMMPPTVTMSPDVNSTRTPMTTVISNSTFSPPVQNTTTIMTTPNRTTVAVTFHAEVLLRNLTWVDAYNDLNSPEYQQLVLMLQQMDISLRLYFLSMMNGNGTSAGLSAPVPVNDIYYGHEIIKVVPSSRNVLLKFYVYVNGRTAVLPDGSMIPVTSDIVHILLVNILGVSYMDVNVQDLSSSTTETTTKIPSTGSMINSTFYPTLTPNSTHISPVQNMTTAMTPNGTTVAVTFHAEVLLRNLTWVDAFNDPNSPEYQQLVLMLQQMDTSIRLYFLSMMNSTSTTAGLSAPVPVYDIYYGHEIIEVVPSFRNVLLKFYVYVNGRTAVLPDGTIIPVTSDVVHILIVNILGVSYIDVYVQDLTPVVTTPLPETTTASTGNSSVACDMTFSSSQGVIESPNYPNSYPRSANCKYLIHSPMRLPITINFMDFEVEASSSSCYDHLTIYDGNSSSGLYIGEYCGTTLPAPVTAFSGVMYLIFSSDNIAEQRGFRAVFNDWSVVTNWTTEITTPEVLNTTDSPVGTCGGYFSTLTGRLASPNYPLNYPDRASCFYYITVPAGYKIVLRIIYFSTESGYDYLRMYDGLFSSSPLLRQLTGSVTGNVIVESTSNNMMLYFYSDGSVNSGGFEAEYTSEVKECLMDQIKCNDGDITSPCVSIYKLCDGFFDCPDIFDEMYCENYTSISSTEQPFTTRPATTSTPWITTDMTTGPPSNIDVRLVNGGNCLEGRVELKINGVWGTISAFANAFDSYAAKIICQQLGFSVLGATPLFNAPFGQADSSVPIWYTSLTCPSYSTRIEDCSRYNSGSGNHNYDVGVKCHLSPTGIAEYDCSFTSTCSFLAPFSSSSVYWSRRNGCTGSSGTGPCSGVQGTSDFYMYLETSSGSTGDIAELRTNVVFDATPRCLSFYYHMYGATINELRVNITSQYDTIGTTLWSMKNEQGNQWHQTSVNIPAVNSLRISFVGVKGSSYTGDIAIDEVRIYRGPCGSVVDICGGEDEEEGVNCTFRSHFACNYSSSINTGNGGWQYKSFGIFGVNLPSSDAEENSNGYYFYQNVNGNEGDSASLYSPNFMSSGTSNLEFYSYFGGSDVGSLGVYEINDGGTRNLLWYKSGEQEDGWLLSCVPISMSSDVVLEFQAILGSSADSVIGLDNVTVSENSCQTGITTEVCDFDQPFTCGYHVNCSCTLPSHVYKWMRHTGSTASKITGPESGAGGKGYYMYAEATYGEQGDATALTFPEFQATGSQNLKFKYHMYGDDIGSLMVQAKSMGDNSISTVWSLRGNQSNEWVQECIPLNLAVNSRFELIFTAVRGNGPIGDIGVDDVIITEDTCKSIATCDFSFGSCDYRGIQGSEIGWKIGQQASIPSNENTNNYFYVMSYSWFEGQQTFLVSPFFDAVGLESVTFDYVNSPFTRFEVGLLHAPVNRSSSDDLKVEDLTILMTTTSLAKDWSRRCVSLGGVTGNVALVFVHTTGIHSPQITAVDNIEISMGDCEEGVLESVCGFDPLDLCGYKVIIPDTCPMMETYRWIVRKIDGNNMAVANSSLGENGDSVILEFPMVSVSTTQMYLRFYYFIDNWDNGKNLEYSIDNGNQYHPVMSSKPLKSTRHSYCTNVGPSAQLKPMFRAEKTNSQTVVHLDDVVVSSTPCPVKTVSCDFDDPFMCGYVKQDSWKRMEYRNQPGEFYMTNSETSLNSSLLISPMGTSTADIQCVEFNYKFSQPDRAHFKLTLYKEGLDSTSINMTSSDDWITLRFQTRTNFDFLALEVAPFYSNYQNLELAAVDDIKVRDGSCQPMNCGDDEQRCSSQLQCVKQSLVCDGKTDCMDGSDEELCLGTMACDFESPRICEYSLTGDHIMRFNNMEDHQIAVTANGGINLLKSPLVTVPTESCLSFLVRSTRDLNDFNLRLIHSDSDGQLTVLKEFGNIKYSSFWIKNQATIPSGNYSVIFEMAFLSYNYNYGSSLFLDDVEVDAGECGSGCGSHYFLCSVDDQCIPDNLVCDTRWDCSDGEDETDCDYSISCSYDNGNCGYQTVSEGWGLSSNEILPGYTLYDHTFQNSTGSFIVAGDLSNLYSGKSMTTPKWQLNQDLCLEFYYIVYRPHEYSSAFLTILQNTSFSMVEKFSLTEYRKDASPQWRRGEFPLTAGYFDLVFIAGGHRSLIAIDDVLMYEGNCLASNSTTSSSTRGPATWETTPGVTEAETIPWWDNVDPTTPYVPDPEPTGEPYPTAEPEPEPTAGPSDPEPTAEPPGPEPTAGPSEPEPTAEPPRPELTAGPSEPEPTAEPPGPEPTAGPEPRAVHGLAETSFVGTTDITPNNDSCITHYTHVCNTVYGLNSTGFPNVFGHHDYNEALRAAYNLPLVYPNVACTRLISHLICLALFPPCSDGTITNICKQSCLDVFEILSESCSQYIGGFEQSVYYCGLLHDEDCITLPDYGIHIGSTESTTEAVTSLSPLTTPMTTPSGERISHLAMIKTSTLESVGILEMIFNGFFGYVQCSSIYCAKLLCQHMGYSTGFLNSSAYLQSHPFVDVYCYSNSQRLSDCYLRTNFGSYSARILQCAYADDNGIDCVFNGQSCLYTAENSYWYLRSNGFILQSQYSLVVTPTLTSTTFTTPDVGSIYVRLQIMTTDLKLHFNLITTETTYYLGDAKYGESQVCFDLPSTTEGYLSINGTADIPFTGYYTIAELYEIKVNYAEPCPRPFPYSVCEFDQKCPVDVGCSSTLLDPIPYQWIKQVMGSNFTGSGSLGYMSADSSFGRVGDTAKFTLPLNASTTQNLKLKFRNTGPRNTTSGSLQVNILNNGMSQEIFKKDDLDTYGSWDSVCVSMSRYTSGEIINGELEFVATRGPLVSDDIQVDDVELIENNCPHFASCDFQSSTFCRYTTTSDSNFQWVWAPPYSRPLYGPQEDHTTGTSGGYMSAVPCLNGQVEGEGNVATLTTPQFDVTTATPMKASFYYHMHGDNMGTIKVYVNHHGNTVQSELEFSIAGSQSDEWYYSCFNLPVDDVTVSLTFSAVLGDGCQSVIALDDVLISEGRCSEKLNEVRCDFEGTNSCLFSSNCTEGSKFQWSRQQTNTPSQHTGPNGDGDGFLHGHFMYVESSHGMPGDVSFLEFPAFTTGNPSSLRFSYHMRGNNIGTLDVLSFDTGSSAVTNLWSKTGHQDDMWIKECLPIPSNREQSIFFRATKAAGFEGDIAVDNIYVVDHGCQASSVSCDFESDDGFLCGYSNMTYYNETLSQIWTPVTNDPSSKNGVPTTSGKYLWTDDLGNAFLLSPVITTRSQVCISFKYFLRSSFARLTILTLNNNTLLWQTSKETGNQWRRGQFQMDVTNDQKRFVVHSVSEVGLDDFVLSQGTCTPLACPGEFSCGDYCIENNRLCDRVNDCEDRSDEANCDKRIDCDFEDPYLCGYDDSNMTMEAKHVLYQNMIYDHTFGNSSGTFFGMVSYSGATTHVSSPMATVNTNSCLSLFYVGNMNSLSISVEYQNRNHSNPYYYDSTMSQTPSTWKPAQLRIESGEITLRLTVTKYSGYFIGYFGIDDISLTSGECPPLECPGNLVPCHRDGLCINEVVQCDKIWQCPSGEDEADCPVSIGCDFERAYGCGYSFGGFTRRQAFHHYLPAIDHTLFNETEKGHYLYFASDSGSTSLMSSPKLTTTGGCVKFYYNMDGGVSAELKVYVTMGFRNSMVFYSNGINIARDQWVEGSFSIPAGEIEIEFKGYGDIYFQHPSSVAIDDILFMEGQSCPQPACADNEFACVDSGVCIPEFLTRNSFQDCLDGSDEWIQRITTNTTRNSTDVGQLISQCTFEQSYEYMCLFSNDQSGSDDVDWQVHSGPTGSSGTGPPSAAVGSYYLYIETSSGDMEVGENARYVSNVINNGNASSSSIMCMSFFYHMYGATIGQLEVIATAGPVTQVLFNKSHDQGYAWYFEKVYIPNIPNVQIIFNAVDGSGFEGDIALDQILLFDGECAESAVPTNVPQTIEPSIRLVGGKTEAYGRLEIQLNPNSAYGTVCSSYFDEDDAAVACRQLGYGTSKILVRSEYGRGQSSRTRFGYEFYCSGREERLSDCLGSTSYCSSGANSVALYCTNTECYDFERSCGEGGVNSTTPSTCIKEDLWCDGNVDCPNSADEITCAQCTDDQFECNNHICVPMTYRCDGIPQCADRSDEFRCVVRDDSNGQVKVLKEGTWMPLCYVNNRTMAQYLCSVTGHGPFTSFNAGNTIIDGLMPSPSHNPNGVITNYVLHQQSSCDALVLQCGQIECGVPSITPNPVTFIFYGNDAVNGEWPWQILLFKDGSSICGATLIDPYFAITAAHCVDNGYQFQIHVGEVKESAMYGINDHGQRINVAQVISHPNYRGSSNSYLSDIAILRLSTAALYNDYVRPACVATELRSDYDNCYVTGWGYTETTVANSASPDNLKEVKVDANYDIERCNKSIQQAIGLIVPVTGICVDNQNPYDPACYGDSGGPLVCQNKYGRWELLGVTSFGAPGCNQQNHVPSIYQSLPYHIDWIVQNTGLQIDRGTVPIPP